LHNLGLKPQSVNNYRDRLASLFGYATKKKYLDRNLISEIETIRFAGKPPEIFTVDELTRLLASSPQELIPALVIGAFAGLRTAELMRLEWSDIDLVRGFINVPAAKAKSARRRLITMAGNLREWLAPYSGLTGRIRADNARAYHYAVAAARKAAGLAKWPQNGLRHTFASMHLAYHQDAAKLALDMGHTGTQLIFSNYRELVHPEEAARFWKIRPAQVAANIVQLAQASA